jgi:hypothetical protein
MVRRGAADVGNRGPPLGVLRGTALLVCIILATAHGARADDGALELSIKAAYIPKFLPFVEWRQGTFSGPSDPMRICIVGLVAGRPLTVQRLAVATRNSGCNVLYASGSPSQSVADILMMVRDTPVLTLTNEGADPKSRGIINFIVRDNHVRFEIDDALAAEAGITISSKLMSLAANVRAKTQ